MDDVAPPGMQIMKLHVVSCAPNYLPFVGGAEVGLHSLLVRCRELSAHRFTVVTATNDRTLPRRETIDGIEVRRFWRPHRSIRWWAPTLAGLAHIPALVSSLDPDVVHLSYALPTGIGGMVGARRAGCPAVMTLGGNDVWDPLFPPPEPLRALGARTSRSAQTVICNSTTSQRIVVEEWGVRSERTTVIPFGVDTRRFMPLDSDARAAARRQWRVADDAQVIVAVQRLERRKGVDLLVEAVAKLGRDPAALVVLIGGKGREEALLRQRVSRLGLEDVVRLVGFVESTELPELLGMADLHVLPTRYEGQGIGIAEAAACGTPSVATRQGGTVDMIDDGKTGLLVDEADPHLLATALREALGNSDRLGRWGGAARHKAEVELALDVTATRFLAVLEAAAR